MKDKVNVGFIGARGHAGRLRQCFIDDGRMKAGYVYLPHSNDPLHTMDFDVIKDCDAVVIASPNDTHIDYLERLAACKFNGYIFCEKPPVNSLDDLQRLRNLELDPQKTFFDFTFRYSSFMKRLTRARDEGCLGELVSFFASVSHGIAFKHDFATSWRARGRVAETVGIHMVDIINLLWGIKSCDVMTANISEVAEDTAYIRCITNDGAVCNIVASYAAPFSYDIAVLGSNGTFTLRDGKMSVRHPRDTFDKDGRFTYPRLLDEEPIDPEEMHSAALYETVKFFMDNVQDNTLFPKELFGASLRTNEILLSNICH